MADSPPIVLYGYETSPFARKAKNLLLLKKLPFKQVDVPPVPPRPELSVHFGIAYRRVPVLAIGRDMYCDTSCIAEALERRFPPSNAGSPYATIYPPRVGGGRVDTGLAKAFTRDWADTTLFHLAVGLIEWEKLPGPFVRDREKLLGTPIVPEHWAQRRPAVLSAFKSHLTILEDQLEDGRTWLFDTTEPGLADVAVHVIVATDQAAMHLRSLLFKDGAFPGVVAWMQRLQEHLDQCKTSSSAITGDEAASSFSGLPDSTLEDVVFDTKEAEALGLSKGAQISVVDALVVGDVPTLGKLVGLTLQEVVIETSGTTASVHCHFPRIGYKVYAQGNDAE